MVSNTEVADADLDGPLVPSTEASSPLEPTATPAAEADTPAESTTAPAEAEAPTDWQKEAEATKALLEEANTALAKVENDNKSLKGRQNDMSPVTGLLDALSNKVDTLQATVFATATSMSAQDETLGPKLDEIKGQAVTVAAQSNFDRFHNTMLAQLQQAGLDSEDTPLLDMANASEFQPIRDAWAQAKASQSMEGIANAYALATPLLNNLRNAKQAEALKVKTTEAEAVRKQTLEDSGVLDTSTGAGTGAAANGSSEALLAKFNTGSRTTTAENTQMDEYLEGLDDTPGSAGIR